MMKKLIFITTFFLIINYCFAQPQIRAEQILKDGSTIIGNGSHQLTVNTSVIATKAYVDAQVGGTAAWGGITGTLSAQTDLQTALNLKLNIADTATMLNNYLRKTSSNIALSAYNTNGFLVQTSTGNFSGRTLTSSSTINITNADGVSANPILDVIENTTRQRIRFSSNGSSQGTRTELNVINGSFVTASLVDNSGSDKMDMTLGSAYTPLNPANNLSDVADEKTSLNNLGLTDFGYNLVTLSNPNAIRFLRVNADNTSSFRTAAELLSDIGAQASGTYLVASNNLSDLVSASTARTNIGATTVGGNFFTLTNPSAITFPRINADNSVSTLDASSFRTAIGAGTGNGSGDALVANPLSQFASTTSAQLAGVISDEVGTGAVVLKSYVDAKLAYYSLNVSMVEFGAPADNTTYYFGNNSYTATNLTTADYRRIYIPVTGTIRIAYINVMVRSTPGTASELCTIEVNYDGGSYTTIGTSDLNAKNSVFSNTGLAIAVTQGHYIEFRITTPVAWTANATNISISGSVMIEHTVF